MVAKKQIKVATQPSKLPQNVLTLEEAHSQLVSIVESSDDAIIGKTLEGIITSWNSGAERIYGYTSDEVLGRSISILAPPDSPDEVPRILKRIKRGEHTNHYETVRVRKDGQHINVSLTISPIEDASGKIMGASTIARDITERKKSDFALQESEYALLERVKELTCLYSLAKLAERPGISLEEILEGIVKLLPPAWQYPEITSGRIILNGKNYLSPNFRDGKDKLSSTIVVNGENRGIVEVVYAKEKPELDEGPFLKEERSLIDAVAKQLAIIVERRETEEEKSRLQDQLRHADRLATIGQLAAGVAHELNEPLGNILGFAQLAKKSTKLSEEVNQDINNIITASLYAREIIKKLMLFGRQTPPRKTKVNLNNIVEEGISFFESRASKEGIKLVRVLSEDLPEITADSGQLTQALVNLVVNALQAMPEGGTLTIKTHSLEDYVSLIVDDTGIGINEGDLKQIFLPFFTKKDVGQGTGLGLAVVHGIVTSHGGHINVKSKVGQGTRFEIQIPIKESQDRKEKE